MRIATIVGRVAAVVAVSAIAAAGATVPANAQEQDNALRVCTPGDYPPYSVTDAQVGYRGVDIDLARGFAAALHRPVTFVPLTWASMRTDFADKNCDLAVGGISDQANRLAYADFSLTYGTDGKTPIVRESDSNDYSTIEQINRPEVRVIANRGGTNEEFARKNFPNAQLSLWPDNLSIFGEIEQGHADVFVTDSVEGRFRVRQHPGLRVLHAEQPFDSFGKVFLIRKNDPVLATEVNAWLATQLATGELDRLLDRWIGPDANEPA